MPVKLIGPKVNFKGKTLWEIVGNLKNLGVGRLVVKSNFENYPEISYYKIVKVQPSITPTKKYDDRRVIAWTEHVFRGKKHPELQKIHYNTNKAMYQLVPKEEEDKYINYAANERKSEVPRFREWPPVMKMLLEQELKTKSLQPLENMVVLNSHNVTVLKDTDEVLKETPPRIYADTTVAELTEKLEALKAAAAEKDTPVS